MVISKKGRVEKVLDIRRHGCTVVLVRVPALLTHVIRKQQELLSFVVDLSVLKNDGGGTQYTFLEAIHNECAIIVHRKWLEGVDLKYSELREGHNCFAVGDEKELAELITSDPDTRKIVNNGKKLMRRHTEVDWSNLFHSIN